MKAHTFFDGKYYYIYLSSIDILNKKLPIRLWRVDAQFSSLKEINLPGLFIDDVLQTVKCKSKTDVFDCYSDFSVFSIEGNYFLSLFAKNNKEYIGIKLNKESSYGLYILRNGEWKKIHNGRVSGYNYKYISSSNCEIYFSDENFKTYLYNFCK